MANGNLCYCAKYRDLQFRLEKTSVTMQDRGILKSGRASFPPGKAAMRDLPVFPEWRD